MLSPCNLGDKGRESDEGGELQGGPIREGHHPDLHPVVRGVPMSYRQVEERMQERGVSVDHATINRWVLKYSPQLEAAFHRRPIAVGPYPVADEIRAFGFRWFPSDDPAPLAAFLDDPDEALHDHNEAIVRQHFSFDRLRDDIVRLLADWRSW